MMIRRSVQTLFVVSLVFTSTAVLSAQEPRPAPPSASSEGAAIQALVAEIRELRLSLERSNLLSLRFQAGLQANQLHADRLKDLSQQLNLVTNQLSQLTRQQLGLSEELKNAERDWNSPDAGIRRGAEQRLSPLKAELQGVNNQVTELRSRESLLLSDIQRETTQMEDWRRWLQQFEQSLQPVR
jgi:chromosome segregation ATPase